MYLYTEGMMKLQRIWMTQMHGEYLRHESVELNRMWGFAVGAGAITVAHFSLDHQKKVSEPLSTKDKLAPSSDLLLCEWVFVHTGSILLILSKHPGYTREREKERKKVFADLTSSYIRREVVQMKLQLFIIPQAADHQKAFTFNLWHYHSVFTCDVRREILFPYCMHQNSIALWCNSLLFIVVGQSTEVQMKTHGPELLRKSLQPFKSTPQFSKWRLSAKAGPVNVFTGNVPMQLRELT